MDNQIICKGDGECLQQYDIQNNIQNDIQDNIQNKMQNLNEIEKFMYDVYLKNYKSKIQESICPLNNKKYIILNLNLII